MKFALILLIRTILWGVAVCSISFALLLFISPGYILWQVFFASTGIVIIILLRKTLSHRKKKHESTIKNLYGSDFRPEANFELKRWDVGHYLGIDTNTGNILMMNSLEKILKGSNSKDLMGYDCRGNVLTLKFNDLSFPFFKAHFGSERESMEYCHRLDVLLSAQYRPSKESNIDFDGFVKNKLQTA
ncbi:hypothetical protein OWY64_004053 [Salmonella enterica]|nr:hypothetical protein [Salmonella enterica]EKE8103931.1 hypothetical protein [Salmonella enterica]